MINAPDTEPKEQTDTKPISSPSHLSARAAEWEEQDTGVSLHAFIRLNASEFRPDFDVLSGFRETYNQVDGFPGSRPAQSWDGTVNLRAHSVKSRNSNTNILSL